MSEPHEETSKENTKIPEIPEESIKEIMLLLPVKSLLKFRCLSPSWLSFIDSPYFIKTHLSKTTPKILLNTPEATMVLDIDTLNPKPVAHASSFKLLYPNATTLILGSCNGVLLTHSNDKNFDNLEPVDIRKDAVLQNPSTRTYHKVPFMEKVWPKNAIRAEEKFIFCLGYDALTDDYKVFLNCQLYDWSLPGGSSFNSHVTVYSMKKKSYKQIEPFPYYVHCNLDASVFVGGALHWVVSTGPGDISPFIASFDVATEKYRVVEQPLYSSEKFLLFLIVLGGCLTVISHTFSLEHVEVWVMNEYGNVESWSKIVSLMAADIGFESINVLKPLLYSKCKKKLLMLLNCTPTMIWYDLEKKSHEIVHLNFHLPKHCSTLLYMESLVKLHGPGLWEEKRGEYNDEKPKKVPKKREDVPTKLNGDVESI